VTRLQEVIVREHAKLRAFQLADEVTVLIYRVTKGFPRDEAYGLTSQMRRAAVSIPSNIVEGCARESEAEYLRFLEIALGSLRELHYQFSLATRLGYVREPDVTPCNEAMNEASKVLSALVRSLRPTRPLYAHEPTLSPPSPFEPNSLTA
jgi:four helix bundle protein